MIFYDSPHCVLTCRQVPQVTLHCKVAVKNETLCVVIYSTGRCTDTFLCQCGKAIIILLSLQGFVIVWLQLSHLVSPKTCLSQFSIYLYAHIHIRTLQLVPMTFLYIACIQIVDFSCPPNFGHTEYIVL